MLCYVMLTFDLWP